ncbi:MAG: DUF1549 domain-containing protein, partial [Planctomycetota bacterium]|nr:DUF1549 domain-containing protein [Planctomycetota bacterium]
MSPHAATNRARAAALAMLLLTAWTTAQSTPSYSRDVRPILSETCFACHGPDEGAREADLRLDVEGHGLGRELLRRITAADPSEAMPPPHAGKALSPSQVETLRAWVADGAKYERHWAFVRPQRPALPTGTDANPIDRFVRARAAAAGLRPAPEADRATLARRLYLDLTGLPPTPAQLEAHLADADDGAYERLVDALLASPHYAERQARRWLDLARYADSNGYEKDRARSIWPYRDWVIRAFDAHMPFDEFVIKQLAGDMLPDASDDDLVATG